MIFTSSTFFLIISFIFILNPHIKKTEYRQILFLFTSYFFYISFDLNFFLLLILISFITYLFGLLINQMQNRLIYSIIGVSIIAFFILFFKLQLYFKFTNYSEKIFLPLGISFYSFQAISYLVDVYKRKLEPEKNLIIFLLYISFFPQLVAGPIERPNNLIPQFRTLEGPTKNMLTLGIKQIFYGYFLKIVVSNNLNILTTVLLEERLDNNILISSGLILFYFQLYFDFHGYTNIAVGLSNVFGIRLNQNFRLPIIARSLKDFWHRWHISLSTWFRDYIYIPLGGKYSKHKYIVLLFVFILSGIWHGPTFNFFLWGFYHAIIYIIEDKFKTNEKFNRFFGTIIVFILVSFGWLFFYFSNLTTVLSIILNFFKNPWNDSFFLIKNLVFENKFVMIVLVFAVMLNFGEEYLLRVQIQKKRMLLLSYLIIDIQLILIILFGFLGNKEFLYFRF